MAESLFEKLKDYSKSGIYPFCMPGHKRNFSAAGEFNPYELDITEVEGFDDLQKCEGILGDIQKELGRIYGAENVFLSVNGSSAGNLAAVAALEDGGKILAASNCHRSVFNGARINKRELLLIDPAKMPQGLKGGIPAEAAEEYLKKDPDIRAIIVTSPTYEGFVSDIPALAEAARRHGALLIVDEAHGAHLPFCGGGYFPETALYQGADIVIESLHKTLPSLNQTSLVFVPHDRALAARVKESLNMVMTTSPSYILMASAQAACVWADQNKESFVRYEELLKNLRGSLSGLKKIRLVDKSICGNYNISQLDPGKLVLALDPEKTSLSGKELFYMLLERYKLQLEKYEDGFVLAMTSVMDTKEGFERLKQALFEIDARI